MWTLQSAMADMIRRNEKTLDRSGIGENTEATKKKRHQSLAPSLGRMAGRGRRRDHRAAQQHCGVENGIGIITGIRYPDYPFHYP